MDNIEDYKAPKIEELGEAKDLIKGFFGKEPGPSDGVIDSNQFS